VSVSYLPNENNLPVCVIHDEWSNRESQISRLRSAGQYVQTFSSLAQARLYAELARANEDLKRETIERQHAEAELHKREVSLREAQIELAYFSRISTMGELTASIAHEVNQPLAGIFGDKIQLQQVLLHLLINAIEAVSELHEGPRELSVTSQKVNEVHGEAGKEVIDGNASIGPESAFVLIAVRDSGPGLSAAEGAIFQFTVPIVNRNFAPGPSFNMAQSRPP